VFAVRDRQLEQQTGRDLRLARLPRVVAALRTSRRAAPASSCTRQYVRIRLPCSQRPPNRGVSRARRRASYGEDCDPLPAGRRISWAVGVSPPRPPGGISRTSRPPGAPGRLPPRAAGGRLGRATAPGVPVPADCSNVMGGDADHQSRSRTPASRSRVLFFVFFVVFLVLERAPPSTRGGARRRDGLVKPGAHMTHDALVESAVATHPGE